MKISPQFITIEGIEGAGKSTALKFIRTYLANHLPETDIIVTREPGGTVLAEEIRRVLLYPETNEKVTDQAELLLMFAGRAQHIAHCILPALEAGQWVLSDRYVDASYAYQGGGRGISLSQIKMLDQWIVHSVYPGLTLLLDLPVSQGLKRTEKRHSKDRIENERVDFFERVRQVYLERANADKERIKLIDASQSLQVVEAQLSKTLNDFIKRVSV